MRSVSKRGRRSRPSSLVTEETEHPLKRTRSTGSSPARSARSTPTIQSRRLEHPPRPPPAHNGSKQINDLNHHRDTSPILEAVSDQENPPPMAPDPKTIAEVNTTKGRDIPSLKKLTTPSLLPSAVVTETADGHISDSSSLSELDDSEAETEKLDDSPRKPASKTVFAYSTNSKPGRLTTSKVPLEPRIKASDSLMSVDREGDAQLNTVSRKRKRENGEMRQKDSSSDSNSQRPITPVANKQSTLPDRNKKPKAEDNGQTKLSSSTSGTNLNKIQGPLPNGKEEASSAPAKSPPPPPPPPPAPDEHPVPKFEVEGHLEDASTETEKQPKEGGHSGDDEVADDETLGETSKEDSEDAERDQTRKAALEALTQIELEFSRLRTQLYEEKIADIEEEMRMVHEGTHPELAAMMEAVDKRRDDKIRLYDVQYKYSLQSHDTAMRATRSQLHSQYLQDVREIRWKFLSKVSETLYQLQRERRACDTVVQDYTFRISADRATRVRERQAYAMEVSILSGIAKYIGFPAAPEVKGASTTETQQDLEAMGIVSRMPVKSSHVRRVDEYESHQYWGNRAFSPSPPLVAHHHHRHPHAHHHHLTQTEQPFYPPRRMLPSSTSTQLSPVTPLPLSLLLDTGPIKLEQAAQQSLPPHLAGSSSHSYGNRSPLHSHQATSSQAHVHPLQHQRQHSLSHLQHPPTAYTNREVHRRESTENGENFNPTREFGQDRRNIDSRNIDSMIQHMEVPRYGKSYT